MTVCVGVAVHDCLVFAADSASTLLDTNPANGQSRIVNVYRHGHKVFNLHKRLPLCAMTCGMGNVGTSSISTLAKDLRARLMSDDLVWRLDPDNYTVEQVAVSARRYLFEERFQALQPQPAAPHSLEFWVGGYGSDRTGHEVWKIEIVNGICNEPASMLGVGGTGIVFGGQATAINRLIVGFDQNLHGTLRKAGMAEDAATNLTRYLQAQLELQLLAPTMPIQDAIDLADFLVETTTRFFRFLPGADVVGGDTDIAVVTRYENFKWIKRKHYYPAHLNRLETDHV